MTSQRCRWTALRRVAELLATCEQLPPASIVTDPPTHRSSRPSQEEHGRQIPFQWAAPTALERGAMVVVAPETTEALVVLMARAMIAVVRAAKEAADER